MRQVCKVLGREQGSKPNKNPTLIKTYIPTWKIERHIIFQVMKNTFKKNKMRVIGIERKRMEGCLF